MEGLRVGRVRGYFNDQGGRDESHFLPFRLLLPHKIGLNVREKCFMANLLRITLPVISKTLFTGLLEDYMKEKPDFQINYGANPQINRNRRGTMASTFGNFNKDSGRRVKHELLTALKNFLLEKRLRAVDLFNFLDKDKTQSVSPDEMFVGLKKLNVPLSDPQLKRLIRILDRDGDGEIDYGEFAAVNEI